MSDMSQLGMQAASQVQGAILGLWNDERQLRQQGKLNRQAIEGSKELTDYNYKKQMEMWEATNYAAQVEQLQKAGLSVGMMYGKGGAGGSTIGVNPGSMSAGHAPVGGREVQDMMQMGMQLELLKAQKENIEADTRNKDQNTKKTWQETNALEMENLLNQIMQSNTPDGKDTGGNIHESAAVKAKYQTLLAEGIKNEVMLQGVKVDQATIEKMAADIAQRNIELANQAKHLDIEQQKVALMKAQQEFENNWGTIMGKEAISTIGGLIKLLPFTGGKK